MIKKFSCQYSAHQVESVRWTRGTAAVAVEARKRICTARLQLGTEDIGFRVHSPSVSKRGACHPLSDADTSGISIYGRVCCGLILIAPSEMTRLIQS